MSRSKNNKVKVQENNNKKKRFKILNLLTGLFLGMFLMSSANLIYNLIRLTGIETIIRYIIIGILILFDLFLIIKYFKTRKKLLVKKYLLLDFLLILFGIIEFFIGYTISKGLNVVDNISVQKYKNYSTSLITLKSNNLTLESIDNETKIGRITDTEDIENYVLTEELIEKDKIDIGQIVDYDDPITMLYELYENKVDAVFISGSYISIYKTMDKFENISEDVVELDKFTKKMKVKKHKETVANVKSSTEPFTMLLMGVDSTEENLSDSSGLGDSLVVITFNPQTLNATILSIPRDTFVPITCYRNVRSKITHAASGGDKCMISTIENFLDVDIDYYAKINFRGLIKLVDALGGIDVEVPYSFCETTMWRSEAYMVYVEEGMQHLNGEQALGLSRNRKTYPRCGKKWNQGTRNDFVRGQNQQLVINALINKAKNISNVGQFYDLLDAVGGSMTTNMDRKQILSFYNLFKNVLINSKNLTDSNNIINMQRMYLNGVGGLYQDGIMSMELYEYVPSNNSLNAIKNAMKVNLGLKEETVQKKFSFSADEEYEPKVIGKNEYGGVDVPAKVSTSSDEDDETVTTTTANCGTNEELGADERTCVCKHGYVRENGVCTKQKVECSSNKEPGADGVTCVCRADYKKSDGTCSTTKISKEDSKLDDDTTDDENNTKQDDTTNSNDDDDNNTSNTETDNNTDNDNTEVIENEE